MRQALARQTEVDMAIPVDPEDAPDSKVIDSVPDDSDTPQQEIEEPKDRDRLLIDSESQTH